MGDRADDRCLRGRRRVEPDDFVPALPEQLGQRPSEPARGSRQQYPHRIAPAARGASLAKGGPIVTVTTSSLTSPPAPAHMPAYVAARAWEELVANWSRTLTFFEGKWHEGNVPIMGPLTNGAWLASTVFDGARHFEGVTPDIDRHCARLNRSAKTIGLNPTVAAETIVELVRHRVKKFGPHAHPHANPMD